MRCGISTACLYPLDTLEALRQVAALGAPVAEIFINSTGELAPPQVAGFGAVAHAAGMDIVSVHPYESPLENIWFATPYHPRVQDGIRVYSAYFAACRALGARFFVLHGMNMMNNGLSLEEYADHLVELIDAGRDYGVQICLENVAYCKLGAPENVRWMKERLGERASFVLDIKQMLRYGAGQAAMLAAMEGHIAHVHISDSSPGMDCLAPGRGEFDFLALLRELRTQGYQGDLVIELYRDGYGRPEELKTAMEYINSLL